MVRDAKAASERRAKKIAVSGEDYKDGVENPLEPVFSRAEALAHVLMDAPELMRTGTDAPVL